MPGKSPISAGTIGILDVIHVGTDWTKVLVPSSGSELLVRSIEHLATAVLLTATWFVLPVIAEGLVALHHRITLWLLQRLSTGVKAIDKKLAFQLAQRTSPQLPSAGVPLITDIHASVGETPRAIARNDRANNRMMDHRAPRAPGGEKRQVRGFRPNKHRQARRT
jgi:hypothetical protein